MEDRWQRPVTSMHLWMHRRFLHFSEAPDMAPDPRYTESADTCTLGLVHEPSTHPSDNGPSDRGTNHELGNWIRCRSPSAFREATLLRSISNAPWVFLNVKLREALQLSFVPPKFNLAVKQA